MTNEEFLRCMKESVIRSERTLAKKEQEYSGGKDRLDQFKRAGAVQDITPTEALVGMMTKHFTSVADMAKDPEEYTIQQWNEKLGDLRNYTFLLDALVRDVREA